MKRKVAVLAITFLTLLSAPAGALNSGGISIHPVNSEGKARSSFAFNATTQRDFNDAVVVANASSESKNVQVYFVDGTVSADGTFACGLQKDTKDDVASWSTPATTELHIKPVATSEVPFNISVPAAAEPGEHNGCIVAQEILSPASKQTFSYRMAIRVSITVPGELKQEMRATDMHIEEDKGKILLKAVLNNTGNISLKANLSATVADAFGKRSEIKISQQTVVRGSKVYLSQEVPRPFWGGNFEVRLHGTYEPYTKRDELRPKSLTAVSTRFISPTSPATAILCSISIVIIGLIVWTIKFVRRQKLYKQWRSYEIVEGDNIKLLGERTSSSWKRIARYNHIAKPYVLAPGQKIKLPPTKK